MNFFSLKSHIAIFVVSILYEDNLHMRNSQNHNKERSQSWNFNFYSQESEGKKISFDSFNHNN